MRDKATTRASRRQLCVPVETTCAQPLVAVTSASQFMHDTLALMEKRNIIGMVSGEPDTMAAWKAAAPSRVHRRQRLAYPARKRRRSLKARTPDELRALHAKGLLDVHG
jgi:hypothetical protein